MAVRLTRIWGVDDNGLHRTELRPGAFRFLGSLKAGLHFVCWPDAAGFCYAIGAPDGQGGLEYVEQEVDRISFSSLPESDLFAEQWLDFFRRCCWLCGCAIEANAHEKIEWIQGFRREELEAWNLKI